MPAVLFALNLYLLQESFTLPNTLIMYIYYYQFWGQWEMPIKFYAIYII